jgi:hypothetical protein
MKISLVISLALALLSAPAWSAPLPGAPTDPEHPGSKIYPHAAAVKSSLTCSGRSVELFLPAGSHEPRSLPLVAFGHGQALNASHYKGTLEHLAKKGVAAAFVNYSTGFFDQDWNRMGRDFVTLTDCALSQNPALDAASVVYAGHSKGAYVASIAAGLAPGLLAASIPRAIVLFAPAGADAATLRTIPQDSAVTVVFSDRDTVVSRDFSETIFSQAGSRRRQLILLGSYTSTSPALNADHMWPLTERHFMGGGPEGPLHYYGSWKWLVAAARDLHEGSRFEDPFLYGQEALEKGMAGQKDEAKRNW